jgi:predicted restriction endonuclease
VSKKEIRAKFRNTVFNRDKYTCQLCGKRYPKDKAIEFLDAHHITNRNEFAYGGYVKENGISLCKLGDNSCHMKAEMMIVSSSELYKKINSSLLLAIEADANN